MRKGLEEGLAWGRNGGGGPGGGGVGRRIRENAFATLHAN